VARFTRIRSPRGCNLRRRAYINDDDDNDDDDEAGGRKGNVVMMMWHRFVVFVSWMDGYVDTESLE
jgi:hypothetical protein